MLLILKQNRLRPYLFVGWFWFVGTPVPLIGIVRVGLTAMAGRDAHIPSIGLYIMLVWGSEIIVLLRVPSPLPSRAISHKAIWPVRFSSRGLGRYCYQLSRNDPDQSEI